MTLGYVWRTLLCFWEITAGLAEVPDKEMGNFIVCRYLENGFCEYWAGRIEAFIQSFTAWILLHLQAVVLLAGCNEEFICMCRHRKKKQTNKKTPIWYVPSKNK